MFDCSRLVRRVNEPREISALVSQHALSAMRSEKAMAIKRGQHQSNHGNGSDNEHRSGVSPSGCKSGGTHDTHLDATDEIRGGVRFVVRRQRDVMAAESNVECVWPRWRPVRS